MTTLNKTESKLVLNPTEWRIFVEIVRLRKFDVMIKNTRMTAAQTEHNYKEMS
jgi:hypothetical protein